MILPAILCGREIGFLPSGKNVNLECLTGKKNAERSLWTYEREVTKRTEKTTYKGAL
jgi:hypothetical protein